MATWSLVSCNANPGAFQFNMRTNNGSTDTQFVATVMGRVNWMG